jgi:cytoskeletal protein RodZ
MSRRKRPQGHHNSVKPTGASSQRREVAAGRRATRSGRGRTLALAIAALTLAAIGIAATAWLTNAQEPTRMTTTASPNPNASTALPATTSPQAQPASASAPQSSPSDASTASTASPASSAPSSAGQRAFIDPVTGQLRQPEHDELAAIAAAAAVAAPAGRLARTSTANAATESFGADGSVEAVVPEDLHTFTVATRGPDGRINIEHAQGAKDAVKVMNANSAKKGPRGPVTQTQGKEDRNDR